MTRAPVFLVAILSIPLAGCLLNGKPTPVAATPAPPKPAVPAQPPEPLSIPQTDVQLPAPQPVDPDALNTEAREEPTPQAPAKPPSSNKPTRPPAAAPQPKPPEIPPVPEQPAAEARAPVHEIMTDDELNRIRDEAHAHQAETSKLLSQAKPRNANQRRMEAEINQFLKQSKDAENARDMRLADQLAERAHILAKELLSGK